MLFSTLIVAALWSSTTLATPLLASLWGSNEKLPDKDRSVPHLNTRDVNNAESKQLPSCRSDDVYDLLTNSTNNLDTRAYCSIYIAASSVVGVFTTTTITGSFVMTTTAATITVTATANATNSSAPCSYSNTTGIPATSGFVSPPVTALSPPLRRQVAPPPPAYLATYDPLRVSSVCSCLVTPSTIVQTWTSFVSVAWTIMTSIQSVTATVTLQAATGVPQPPGASVVTSDSISPISNGPIGSTTTVTLAPGNPAGDTRASTVTIPTSPINTANTSVTILPVPGNTVGATFTILPIPAGSTATISVFPTSSTVDRPTISIFRNNTVSATGTGSLPSNTTRNATATASGFPAPTGTNPSTSNTYCDQAFARGNGTFRARYTVRCGYSYTNLNPLRIATRPSYAGCVQECDNDSRCYAFSFLLASDTENCYIYNYFPLPSGNSDVLFDSGAYVVGSNDGMRRRQV